MAVIVDSYVNEVRLSVDWVLMVVVLLAVVGIAYPDIVALPHRLFAWIGFDAVIVWAVFHEQIGYLAVGGRGLLGLLRARFTGVSVAKDQDEADADQHEVPTEFHVVLLGAYVKVTVLGKPGQKTA